MNELRPQDIDVLRQIKLQGCYASVGSNTALEAVINAGYAKVVSGTPKYFEVEITSEGEAYLAALDAAVTEEKTDVDLLGGLTLAEYQDATERTSLLTWWPALVEVACELADVHDVLLPPTDVVILPPEIRANLYGLIGEGPSAPKEIEGAFRRELEAVAEKRGMPLFLRTDLTSSKHGWRRSCYVDDDVWRHALELVYASLCPIPELPVKAFVVRKYISLESKFTAFAGMPIAPELRVMVRDGVVERAFPYWPREAFERTIEVPENWESLLTEVNQYARLDSRRLTLAAAFVGSKLPGYWSVDFALAKNAGWYLIDMADGRISWTADPKEDTDGRPKR